MSLVIKQHEEGCLVSGKGTYSKRGDLKRLGGKWNATLKSWVFPKDKKEELEKMTEESPKVENRKVEVSEKILEGLVNSITVLTGEITELKKEVKYLKEEIVKLST